MRAWLSLLIYLGWFAWHVDLRADEASDFFEQKIRPVLIEHCYECHAADSKKVQGGLLLDTRDGIRKGGDSGPSVVPGNVGESLILSALRHDLFQMPPKGKLPKQVVLDFEHWIRQGAYDPRESAVAIKPKNEISWEEVKKFWSFSPRTRPDLPSPLNMKEWEAGTAVDRFIQVKLEEQGLSLSPPADRYTLLRRMTFDLTGLPPTYEEIREFISDESPLAIEKLLDRLLSSPAYGERWGRYWLDLARYANSNGADENHSYPNAWRYRDYVVAAFNKDTPYDRFVTQQLAGDLLPYSDESERRENLTATGFLVLGPKMLAEQDKPKLIADLVDEQIDTVGLTFSAMTYGCARCHDHKFDPILAEDYYALAGIFHSTRSMEHMAFVSQWNERDLPQEELQLQIDHDMEFVQAARDEVEIFLKRAGVSEKEMTEDQKSELKKLRQKVEDAEKTIIKLPKAMACDEAKVKEVPVHARGNHLHLVGAPIARRFPKVFEGIVPSVKMPEENSGRLELARWLVDPKHPLTARVMANRIWQGHFGEGIVRSSSNFGFKGDLPTHPELLDYLAEELIRSEWSLKALHRTIMLSRVYQQKWRSDADGERIDPDNKWLWRQNRRRLEFEPMRDSLLAVAGNLDSAIGGQVEPIYGEFTQTRKPRGGDDVLRRTIYLTINRAAISELFATFDYVESSVSTGKRSSTTVPHQALFLMNSPFVIEQASEVAKRVLTRTSRDQERIDYLFHLVVGRPTTQEEMDRAIRYLKDFREEPKSAGTSSNSDREEDSERVERGWKSLARALLATNEFLYVD